MEKSVYNQQKHHAYDDVNSTREILTHLFILIKSTVRLGHAHLIHDEYRLGDTYELRTVVYRKKAMYYLHRRFTHSLPTPALFYPLHGSVLLMRLVSLESFFVY